MPISGSVTLEELITEILKQDRSAVITAFQNSAQPIYQSIFDKGHSAAVAKHAPEKAQLEGQVANLTTQITQKDEQIKQLGEKAPDVAALQSTHAENIRKLEEKHSNEIKAANATLVAERVSRAERDLVLELIGLGTDSEYAEVVLDKAKRNNRIRSNTKGQVEFFRADTDAPFAASNGKEPLKLLAEELRATVPPKFVTVNGDTGSGTTSSTTGGTGGAKKQFEAIRADVKKKEERNAPGDSGLSRLSGAPSRAKSATA